MLEKIRQLPVSIFGKRSQQDLEFVGTVSEKYYSLLKRYVRVEQDETLDTDLKLLLASKGWLAISPKITDIPKYLEQINISTDVGPCGLVYNALIGSRVPVPFLSSLFRAQRESPE